MGWRGDGQARKRWPGGKESSLARKRVAGKEESDWRVVENRTGKEGAVNRWGEGICKTSSKTRSKPEVQNFKN